MTDLNKPYYPLLQTFLDLRDLALKPTYTNSEVAAIFDVSSRTVQARIQRGDLISRDLIGRGKFLPADLEDYIVNSRRDRSVK